MPSVPERAMRLNVDCKRLRIVDDWCLACAVVWALWVRRDPEASQISRTSSTLLGVLMHDRCSTRHRRSKRPRFSLHAAAPGEVILRSEPSAGERVPMTVYATVYEGHGVMLVSCGSCCGHDMGRFTA